MPKYSNTVCSQCHVVLPADEMYRYTSKQLTGSSAGTANTIPNFLYREGGSRSRSTGSVRRSSRKYYKMVTEWLCPDCYQYRVSQRRKRFLLKASLWIGGAMLLFALGQKPKPSDQPTNAVNEQGRRFEDRILHPN